MPWNRPKKQCPYNEWVYCRDETCDGCGWYPKQEAEEEETKEQNEKS